jgi:ArsR family transcriptional regulator, arsenate/arsenite/antimonite-responsive transcriptional repressor
MGGSRVTNLTAKSQRAKTGTACCPPISQQALSAGDADDLAQIFTALGDPVRLRLFSMIAAEGEACSCNLEVPLDRSQPTISHHTRILADAGLIVGEKRGKWTWWRVVPGRLSEVRTVLKGVR